MHGWGDAPRSLDWADWEAFGEGGAPPVVGQQGQSAAVNGAVGIATEKAEKGLDQGSDPGRGPSSVPEEREHQPRLEGSGEEVQTGGQACLSFSTNRSGLDDLEAGAPVSRHCLSSSHPLKGCSISSPLRAVGGLLKSQTVGLCVLPLSRPSCETLGK